jgi:hypothetical protein
MAREARAGVSSVKRDDHVIPRSLRAWLQYGSCLAAATDRNSAIRAIQDKNIEDYCPA